MIKVEDSLDQNWERLRSEKILDNDKKRELENAIDYINSAHKRFYTCLASQSSIAGEQQQAILRIIQLSGHHKTFQAKQQQQGISLISTIKQLLMKSKNNQPQEEEEESKQENQDSEIEDQGYEPNDEFEDDNDDEYEDCNQELEQDIQNAQISEGELASIGSQGQEAKYNEVQQVAGDIQDSDNHLNDHNPIEIDENGNANNHQDNQNESDQDNPNFNNNSNQEHD